MSEHADFLHAMRLDPSADTAFLAYADFIHERYGEDAAATIRDVVNRTTETIRGSDERAKARAIESRSHLTNVGFSRERSERQRYGKDVASERLLSLLSKPTSSDIPHPSKNG